MADKYPRILTRKQVMEIIPYSHTQLWRLERAGKFPRKIKLGPNRVGWLAEDIENWIGEKIPAKTAGG